jgi:acetyl esterase/lipase
MQGAQAQAAFGTTLRFKLNEAATVKLTLSQPGRGHKVSGKCVAQSDGHLRQGVGIDEPPAARTASSVSSAGSTATSQPTLAGPSMETKAAVDVVLAPDRLRGNVADYAGSADPASGALSPLFADLHGIAPLLIQCGSNEVLLDDATRLAVAAAAADAAVQLDVTPEVGHVFQASAPELDKAEAALTRTGAFLQAYLQLAE